MHMYELLTPLRRRGSEPVPVGTAIPLSWDDGETLVRLGAAVRVEAVEIAPASNDADRDTRRRELLRQLADVSGVPEGLMVVVAPSSAGAYLMTVGDGGVTDIQPYDAKADPLANADPAVIRRRHLDALRDLDDMTYIGFDDSAATDLSGLVLLSMDEATGLVTAVTARSAAPVGFDVARSEAITGTAVSDEAPAGTGETARLDDAAKDDSQAQPPVVVVPADDEALAKMTRPQLLVEAARVSATFDDGMTKPQLVNAIVAKRVSA